MFSVLLAGMCGCPAPRPASAGETLRLIEEEFTAGDLLKAQADARGALSRSDLSSLAHEDLRLELAKIYLYRGMNEKVLALLDQSSSPSTTDATLVLKHTIRSLALARLGQTGDAERELADAERVRDAERFAGEIAQARGSLDLEMGRLDRATEMFQKALNSARQHADSYLQARMLLNLGVIELQEEHYEDALVHFKEAQTIGSHIGAGLTLEKAEGSIGYSFYGLGDFPRALESFQLARTRAAALGSPVDEIEWLNNEGLTQFRMGDSVAARASYEGSLAAAAEIASQEEIVDAHSALGLLLLNSDLPAAAEHVKQAAHMAELRSNLPEQRKAGLLQAMIRARQGATAEAMRSLLILDRMPTATPSFRWQAEQELARLHVQQGDEAAADRWFRRAIETFSRQRSSLRDVESDLPFLENGSNLYSDYVEHLVAQGKTNEALEVVDQGRAEALLRGLPASAPASKGRYGAHGGANALAGRLGGTILVYYLLPRGSYLWAITAARTGFYRLPGEARISTLVHTHGRAILAARDLSVESDAAGRLLFEQLIRPAADLVPHGQHVFVLADKALNSLNFETLLATDGQPHFWIEDAVITHIASLRMLSTSTRQRGETASKRLLLVGDPAYRDKQYMALPNAAEEISAVMNHFSAESRTVLRGSAATPSAYRAQRPGEFDFIHFVAHATVDPPSPLDSAVVLSGGDGQSDKLYAREILVDRLKADLVTISGCYSSGSRSYAGEGLVGLAWAFERSGSRNVIGALWEVSDSSTPALMNRLYEELASGASPSEGLRTAKLSLLHSPGVFRKPFYWAPFQLYSMSGGASGPISGRVRAQASPARRQ